MVFVPEGIGLKDRMVRLVMACNIRLDYIASAASPNWADVFQIHNHHQCANRYLNCTLIPTSSEVSI